MKSTLVALGVLLLSPGGLPSAVGESGLLKVGIAAGPGAEGISQALTANGFAVGRFARFDKSTLDFDVLILPGKVCVGRLESPTRALVMEYAHRGFGVMLTGDACGFRTWGDDDISPFPDVEHPVGKTASFALRVRDKRHPVARGLATEFVHAYWDHINMEVGPAGKAVVEDLKGLPVVVAGEVGGGRVVAIGQFMGITAEDREVAPESDELKLLLNAVKWLGATAVRDRHEPFEPRPQILERLRGIRRQIDVTLCLEDTYCPIESGYDLLAFEIGDLVESAASRQLLAEADRERQGFLDEVRRIKRLLGISDFSDLPDKEHERLLRRADTESGVAEPQKNARWDISEPEKGHLMAQVKALGESHQAKLESLKARMANLPRKPERLPRGRVVVSADILKAMAKESDPLKRRKAALELGRIGGKDALGDLLGLLNDPDQEVRVRAINSVAWTRDKAAATKLLPLLQDADLRVRRRAVQALGLLGDASAIPKLEPLVDDKDPDVSENAKIALQWLRREQPLPPVVERPVDYDYDWHLNEYSRIHHLAYTGSMRPWPWERLAKYAAYTHTTAAFVEDREGIELASRHGIKVARWSGKSKEKMLKDLQEFGNLPAFVVVHYDEPTDAEIDKLPELADFAHTLRKDLLFSTVLMKVFAHQPSQTSYVKAAKAVDILCVDPYDGGAMEEAFLMDLQRSCARGVNWVTLSGFVPGPGHSAQDLALPYAHAQGVWLFVWQYYWKQNVPIASVSMRKYWSRGGRWQAVVRNYEKMAELEPYLVRTQSVAEVALVFSERTGSLPCYVPPNIGRPSRYFQNQAGIYHALTQEHVQFDSIFAENLPAMSLDRYKVLVLSDARALSGPEMDAIREWVGKGGALIATGQTTLFSETGDPLADYSLGNLFGAKYLGVEGGEPTDRLNRHVPRELAAPGPFVDLAVPKKEQTLAALGGRTFRYEEALGFDRVEPARGTLVAPVLLPLPIVVKRAAWAVPGTQVVATWHDKPALLSHPYMKGTVFFLTAHYPGLTYQDVEHPLVMGRAWFPQWKQFYKGNTEFLAALVRSALQLAGTQPRLTVTGCPKTVEVQIRAQPSRWMVHFTNYDERQDVKPFDVLVSTGQMVRGVFFAEGGAKASFKASDGRLTFRTRPFHLHDMAAIEFGD